MKRQATIMEFNYQRDGTMKKKLTDEYGSLCESHYGENSLKNTNINVFYSFFFYLIFREADIFPKQFYIENFDIFNSLVYMYIYLCKCCQAATLVCTFVPLPQAETEKKKKDTGISSVLSLIFSCVQSSVLGDIFFPFISLQGTYQKLGEKKKKIFFCPLVSFYFSPEIN